MITVLHYEGNKDPDVYYGLDQNAENKIIKGLKNGGMEVTRATDEEWFGQSDPRYSVRHWNVKRRKR